MSKGYHLQILAWLLLLPVAASGCGTILGYGGRMPITVITDPEGASLIIDGLPVEGITPCDVEVSTKDPHVVEAKLEDGKKGQTNVGKKIRTGVLIGDIFTLGLGLLVDYSTGALYKLDTPIKINLGKSPVRPPEPPPTPEPVAAPTPGPGATDAAPCSICGEPRGDVSPCPHCGME